MARENLALKRQSATLLGELDRTRDAKHARTDPSESGQAEPNFSDAEAMSKLEAAKQNAENDAAEATQWAEAAMQAWKRDRDAFDKEVCALKHQKNVERARAKAKCDDLTVHLRLARKDLEAQCSARQAQAQRDCKALREQTTRAETSEQQRHYCLTEAQKNATNYTREKQALEARIARQQRETDIERTVKESWVLKCSLILESKRALDDRFSALVQENARQRVEIECLSRNYHLAP